MLARFIVGAAVRTAARAAVASHYEQKRREAAQLSGPFAFLYTPEGETGVFVDRRIGFRHTLPGYPRPLHPMPQPHEPPFEAIIGLTEVPVAIRYRFDRPVMSASSAADFAMRLAHVYVSQRTTAPTAPSYVQPDRCALWSVEGAARAVYPLPAPDPWGADEEELLVQVSRAVSMTITVRYPRAFREQDWLRKALLDSVLFATPTWDPARVNEVPRVWPDSAFLEPGLGASLKPHPASLAPTLAPAMPRDRAAREAVASALGAVLASDLPPWAPLDAHGARHHLQPALSAAQSEEFHAAVERGLPEIRNAQDLRGLALMLGRALEPSA